MAGSGAPWQLEFEKVEQRCGYLLTSGEWSDCTFMVGPETDKEAIQAHQLVLAMTSPVFESMFYGRLANPIVSISDVQPEAFRALLQYIYTGNIEICSMDMALDLWYGAKKYMLPHLVRQCTSYICSVVVPGNVIQAYEHAQLLEDETVLDKCIQIISTNTKEVLAHSSFLDVELATLISVCSLDHLNVDSELDLFHAVARYAQAEQVSPPAEGGPSKELLNKVSLPQTSSVGTSPAAELLSTPAAEVVTSEPTADKENLKEEEPSIRAALQKLRFLSLSAAQFAEGPARSALLTKDEKLAVLMNIASGDNPMPMPTGFSECREQRQPRSDTQEEQFFEAGSFVDHTINAPECDSPQVEEQYYDPSNRLDGTIYLLQCGHRSQVQGAAVKAAKILRTRSNIQPALDKGILDALVPALTEGTTQCKLEAARAIHCLCHYASPAQLRVLAESAALLPYCHLLIANRGFANQGFISYLVVSGLDNLLQKCDRNTKADLLRKMRARGIPQLMWLVVETEYANEREVAQKILRTYFNDIQ